MSTDRNDKSQRRSNGSPFEECYGPENWIPSPQEGIPGQYPFTRGIRPNMYRGRLWTMRQYSGYASAEETNKRYREFLSQGQTGLSVAFDLPTQMGYDPDDSMAEGEIGKVGVSIACLEDLDHLFDGIDPAQVSVSMTINSTASILLALYVALAKRRGTPLETLSGTIQNDILKEYVARGTYIYPPEPSLRLVADTFEYCAEHLPRWNTISVSGYHIREAGSTAAQEIGFTLANGICYVETALAKGLDIDVFAPRVSFFFNSHNLFLEEVAKFRAARGLWARIVRERFGAKEDNSCRLRFHTQTAGSTLTSEQLNNNLIRVAIQALAGVLGGTQSLHTNSRDEALSLPSEESALLALRTQQIIAHESGVADTVNPLGGSYCIEALTDQLEKEAEAIILRIDEMGGVLRAIDNGFIQREIENAAYEYQKDIEEGKRTVVGVNQFVSEEPEPVGLFTIDPGVQSQRVEWIKNHKQSRNQAEIGKLLEDLKETAASDRNLIPCLVECVENGVTLGEISGVLREVFGTYVRSS